MERLTPALIRVVLGGDGLAGFETPAGADAYVNLAVPPPGAPYGPVFDVTAVREEHDKAWWPARRRYTVRSWDPERRLLTIDFVVHGDAGVAGPWAARAQAGDVLVLDGPSGGYHPDEEADWHLMVGDESALPAIAACLEAVAPGRRVVALLVCDGPDHEIPLTTPGRLELRWLHRRGSADPAGLLLAALEDLDFPAGRVDAFIHGEADEIRGIRRHLLAERGLERAAMSCSPYWRRTMSDEDWRRVKADFVAAMESDVA
ncbi:siderophore-interacting protein [Myroides odoratimimus subsp. xuanwuensis]